MSSPDDAAGWRAYGGAGDRTAVARAELARAEGDLQRLLSGRDLNERAVDSDGSDDVADAEIAEAWYRLGRARTRASYLPGRERFLLAYEAMQRAVDTGDAGGTTEQRSRWWTGLGGSLKNLVTDPSAPAEHAANLEKSLVANLNGLALARRLDEQPERLSAALSSTGMAYQYRDLGSRAENIENATDLMSEAVALNLDHGCLIEAAIVATGCGIAWVEHPNEDLGLSNAAACYAQARHHLDTETFPAHARRLGRSAGWAACRQGDWETAANWYDMAWKGVQTLIRRAGALEDKRRELAEHGDASSKHVYSTARSGSPGRAVKLADDYADLAASLAHRSMPPSAPRTPEDSQDDERQTALCYLACTHVGAIALLTPSTGPAADSPDAAEDRDRKVEIVLLDDINSNWLKDELAWPAAPMPAHGPGVSTEVLDLQARDDYLLSPELLRRLERHCITPVLAAAERAGYEHLYVVPRAALAEAPLAAAWSLTNARTPSGATTAVESRRAPRSRSGAFPSISPTLSLLPRAQLSRRRSQATGAPRRTARLVTIALAGDPDSPLGWTEVESQALDELFPGTVTSLRGSEATIERILEELPAATHIHFAGHGSFSPTDPPDTHFTCFDGQLSLAHLATNQALASSELFIASGCSLGSSDNVRLPDEGLGLPAALLQQFSCSVIAPIRPVYDIAAALFAIKTAELLWRYGIDSPARAVREAQRWLARANAEELLTWAATQPTLGLEEAFALLDHDENWQERPDVWAPFSYFGW